MSANLTNGSNVPVMYAKQECFASTAGTYVMSTVFLAYILLVLPLTLFVLYLGIRRWRQQSSVSTAGTMSHADFFAYNLAVIELIAVFTYFLYLFSNHLTFLINVAQFLGFFSWFGQMILPILTCVDRYLAVVYPITYLSLRQVGWVRIRNISTGCVWLLSLGGAGFLFMLLKNPKYSLLPATPILLLFLVVMTFCSLSPLRVLIRPRPGKVVRDRAQVDPSKQRAIHIIMVILGVLWLKLGWNVISITLGASHLESVRCLAGLSTVVFSLPSSLVLPLLFLHRAGKLPRCGHIKEPG